MWPMLIANKICSKTSWSINVRKVVSMLRRQHISETYTVWLSRTHSTIAVPCKTGLCPSKDWVSPKLLQWVARNLSDEDFKCYSKCPIFWMRKLKVVAMEWHVSRLWCQNCAVQPMLWSLLSAPSLAPVASDKMERAGQECALQSLTLSTLWKLELVLLTHSEDIEIQGDYIFIQVQSMTNNL